MREALFKDQILSDRERKNLAILEAIRKAGPISRTDISRFTKLNIVTVSNYINNFIEKGLVLERGLDVSSGGRKPVLVELNSKNGFVMGVDIGPRDFVAIVTNLVVDIIAKVKRPRPAGMMEEVITSSIKLIRKVLEDSNIEPKRIKGLGVGISGVIDVQAGTVRDTDPARGRTTGSFLSIKRRIEEEFKIPAFVGNDATVAAFGEKRMGAGTEVENLLYMYSDVGCGIIIKGDIYCGAGGSAGEMQLSIESPDEDRFNCWAKGPCLLRPWGVDLGIVSEAKNLLAKGVDSKILDLVKGNLERIDASTVIKAAEQEDEVALGLLENAGVSLGVRIAYLINLFNPEIVVIGGGMQQAGDHLLEPIRKTVKKFAFVEPASSVKIIPSRLGEDAVALGAASLVVREIFLGV